MWKINVPELNVRRKWARKLGPIETRQKERIKCE